MITIYGSFLRINKVENVTSYPEDRNAVGYIHLGGPKIGEVKLSAKGAIQHNLPAVAAGTMNSSLIDVSHQ